LLETIAAMLALTAVEVVGGALVIFALAYAALHFWRRRSKRRQDAARSLAQGVANEWVEPALVPSMLNMPSPKILGKLRSGREHGRLSEDDLAQQNVGRRGLPGEPAPPNDLRESETQIPKPLDPGHTA
jgi:hypothetical protein